MAASKIPVIIFGGLPRTLRMLRPTSRSDGGKNSRCRKSKRSRRRPNQAMQITASWVDGSWKIEVRFSWGFSNVYARTREGLKLEACVVILRFVVLSFAARDTETQRLS